MEEDEMSARSVIGRSCAVCIVLFGLIIVFAISIPFTMSSPILLFAEIILFALVTIGMILFVSRKYRADTSEIKSGRRNVYYIQFLSGIVTMLFASFPFILLLASLFSTTQISWNQVLHSGNYLMLANSWTILPFLGFYILYKVIKLEGEASKVEYGLVESLGIDMSTIIASILLMCNFTMIQFYYILTDLSEPLRSLSLIGIIINPIYILTLLLMRKGDSVEKVYDIPIWNTLHQAITRFNDIQQGRKLDCSFIHRVSTAKPPEDNFNDAVISYKKRLDTTVIVCLIQLSNEDDWVMIPADDEDIADSLYEFLTNELGVVITRNEKEKMVGIKLTKGGFRFFKSISM